MQGVLILLALVAMLLLLPVLLPVVAVLHKVSLYRKTQDAEEFACVRCGRILGRAGLQLGDAVWAEHFAALRRAHPHVKLRVVRHVHAVCPACGARYGYDEEARTFRPISTPEA